MAVAVFTRLLDGVDPEVTDEITHALSHTQGVRDVTEIRLRWSGHRLHAEVNLAVSRELSVATGHAIAVEAGHQLMHNLPYLSNVTIHIDPEHLSGEEHHRTWSTRTKARRSIRIDRIELSVDCFFLRTPLIDTVRHPKSDGVNQESWNRRQPQSHRRR